ncbi:F0F1 ATP synthase subunit alpha, partial [Listeria fleischmannii FSL S10-1203]
DVLRFESEMNTWFDHNRSELLEEIRTTKSLPDEEKLNSALNEFKNTFVPSEEK